MIENIAKDFKGLLLLTHPVTKPRHGHVLVLEPAGFH